MTHDENKGLNDEANSEHSKADDYVPTKYSEKRFGEPKEDLRYVSSIIGACLLGLAISRLQIPPATVVAVSLAFPVTSPLFYIVGKWAISRKNLDDPTRNKYMLTLTAVAIVLLVAPIAALLSIGENNIITTETLGLWVNIGGLFNAVVLAAMVMLLYLSISKNQRRALKVLWVAVLITSSYVWGGLVATNSTFDTSQKERTPSVVTGFRVRTGERSSTYFIFVEPMNSSDSRVRVRVGRNLFNNVEQGDVVNLCTRQGFWGFEWVCCVSRIDPALQPFLSDQLDELELLLE